MNKPIARVLLVGAFAGERHSSYIPWVLWARYLAERGIEVLRYDYRGVGESSGAFEEMTFSDWSEDVHLLAKWLKDQSPEVPLVLHGLGVGALLASRAFHGGAGEVLLLWSPPESANQAVRSAVVRWINVEQLFKYGDERKPASAFIQELELGSSVEVENCGRIRFYLICRLRCETRRAQERSIGSRSESSNSAARLLPWSRRER